MLMYHVLLTVIRHLAQVLLDSLRDVLPSLCDEAEQVPQLVDPAFQRFGFSRLEGLPGPLHGQLLSGHPSQKATARQYYSRLYLSANERLDTLIETVA